MNKWILFFIHTLQWSFLMLKGNHVHRQVAWIYWFSWEPMHLGLLIVYKRLCWYRIIYYYSRFQYIYKLIDQSFRGFQVQPWSSRVQADKSNNRMEHCRFGEEGCLFFLPFQEDLERKAEVSTLIQHDWLISAEGTARSQNKTLKKRNRRQQGHEGRRGGATRWGAWSSNPL